MELSKEEIRKLFVRMQDAGKKYELYKDEGFAEMTGVAAEAIEILEFEQRNE